MFRYLGLALTVEETQEQDQFESGIVPINSLVNSPYLLKFPAQQQTNQKLGSDRNVRTINLWLVPKDNIYILYLWLVPP